MTDKFKAACVQITSSNDLQDNVRRASEFISEAAAAGADFVATPENVVMMAATKEDRTKDIYEQDKHPALKAFAELAEEKAIWLLVGSVTVKHKKSDKPTNSSFLISPRGKIEAHYDKIHMFDADLSSIGGKKYTESEQCYPGEEAVVADLPWCKLGMIICYDLRFPHLARALAHGGAEVITVPAAFAVETGKLHWEVLLRAKAIMNSCFVIAPGQTGTHVGGRKTYGHSMIINPYGEILANAGIEEGIITADIDLDVVKKMRTGLPSIKHDRPFKLRKS